MGGLPPEARRAQGGGQSGIRTHGTRERTLVFKTSALNHSAICPREGLPKDIQRDKLKYGSLVENLPRHSPN